MGAAGRLTPCCEAEGLELDCFIGYIEHWSG